MASLKKGRVFEAQRLSGIVARRIQKLKNVQACKWLNVFGMWVEIRDWQKDEAGCVCQGLIMKELICHAKKFTFILQNRKPLKTFEKGSSNMIFAFWNDHPRGMVESGLKGTRVSQGERRFGWDDLG